MQVKSTNQPRALYSELKSKYAGRGAIITDSYLMLMKSIQGTITTVQFDVLNNVGTPTVNEVRLNITDRFCVREMSMFLAKAGASTAATNAEVSVARPSTFPNLNIFTGANEAANLEAVYNGNLRVVIDSVVYYQSLDTRRFYRAGQAQQGTAVSSVATTGIQARDQYDMLNYAFSPVYPTFELNGIGKNEVTLTIPNPTVLSGTSSQNFVCLLMRGFLVQNINQSTR